MVSRLLLTVVLALFCSLQAWAEFAWPTEATVVRINGQVVPAFWREGLPYVERVEAVHLLHIRAILVDTDLPDAAIGYDRILNMDGSIDASKIITIDAVHQGSSGGDYYLLSPSSAGGGGRVYVKGYTRKDGTDVQPYTRRNP